MTTAPVSGMNHSSPLPSPSAGALTREFACLAARAQQGRQQVADGRQHGSLDTDRKVFALDRTCHHSPFNCWSSFCFGTSVLACHPAPSSGSSAPGQARHCLMPGLSAKVPLGRCCSAVPPEQSTPHSRRGAQEGSGIVGRHHLLDHQCHKDVVCHARTIQPCEVLMPASQYCFTLARLPPISQSSPLASHLPQHAWALCRSNAGRFIKVTEGYRVRLPTQR